MHEPMAEMAMLRKMRHLLSSAPVSSINGTDSATATAAADAAATAEELAAIAVVADSLADGDRPRAMKSADLPDSSRRCSRSALAGKVRRGRKESVRMITWPPL